MKRFGLVAVGFLVVAAGCGNGDRSAGQTAESIAADTAAPVVGADENSESSVEIAPGALAEGRVTIDGTDIDYVTVVPEGFQIGDEAPVLFALPPGGQSLDTTRSLVAGTYLSEALDRGWVVISPAAPDGQLYFQGSEELVPGLLDWVDGWVTPEDGRVHIAGVSNGGLSAFRIAGQQPDRVASVIAFPGYPRSEQDVAALAELTDIPIRMFAGQNDTGWVQPMQETEVEIVNLGGDVVLVIFPGEGHIIGALSDGVQIFDELDAAR